ncbi:hypothetical protein K435DRAFT_963976 [Dendrothele bispora CBS 962.96]|uniref:Uncharacterized protein n=1 Tax=Dendrothele bispora (strain CBS 962.96) TaxID=1314807 RepID=A0A4S8MDB7_DENBC|nr:hypothetical protein K435DRAFT_963976 [Dendrothele bispora CBS 962.96]
MHIQRIPNCPSTPLSRATPISILDQAEPLSSPSQNYNGYQLDTEKENSAVFAVRHGKKSCQEQLKENRSSSQLCLAEVQKFGEECNNLHKEFNNLREEQKNLREEQNDFRNRIREINQELLQINQELLQINQELLQKREIILKYEIPVVLANVCDLQLSKDHQWLHGLMKDRTLPDRLTYLSTLLVSLYAAQIENNTPTFPSSAFPGYDSLRSNQEFLLQFARGQEVGFLKTERGREFTAFILNKLTMTHDGRNPLMDLAVSMRVKALCHKVDRHQVVRPMATHAEIADFLRSVRPSLAENTFEEARNMVIIDWGVDPNMLRLL